MSIPNRIAILESDGTTDTAFAPGAGLNDAGYAVNVNADGDVAAGGAFTMVSGAVRAKLAVFDSAGALVSSTPTPSSTVRTIVPQTDGKLILGGNFTTIDGTTRNRVARLLSDYTLESAFNSNANAAVYAGALQTDGKLLIGGEFTQVGATTRNRVARLYNDAATNALSVVSTTYVQWLRGGAAEEVQQVTIEKDIGAGYVTTGITVARIAGGWAATITPALITGSIRARAYPTDSHSEGLIEEILAYVVDPEIEVSAEGTIYTSGVGTLAFGSTQVGIPDNIVVTITNRGLANLTLTSAALTTGTQWSIPTQPATPVLPGGTASFTLVFNPTSTGAKTDTVTITNNDPTYGTFTIALTGTGTPGPGSVDTAWQPIADSFVYALSRSTLDLSWVGGVFTTMSGLNRGRYARINDSAVVQTQSGTGANGTVRAVCQLPDGKVLIGGTFTAINGVTRNRLARLNADGSLDASFNISLTGSGTPGVECFALQADGAVLVGGNFMAVNGVSRIAIFRLTSTGAVDTTFSAGFSSTVQAIVVQTDGKILVGGTFTNVDGNSSKRFISRRNADGSEDSTFVAPFTTSVGGVTCVAVDSTGKVLLAGPYNEVASVSKTGLNRFSTLGVLDATFANVVADARSVCVQADGNVLVGGAVNGSLTSTERLFRVTTLGAADTTFAATARNSVLGVALQEDGAVLVGGAFTLAGSANKYLARVVNGSASSSLVVVGPTELQWSRGGTTPECQIVVFDLSQDSGSTWARLGQGTRVSGGWSLTGISLPVSGIIRARAYVQGGAQNGSVSIMEEQVSFSGLLVPDLVVQYPVGTTVSDEGTLQFPATLANQTQDIVVTLLNTGGATLSSIVVTTSLGNGLLGEWSIISAPASSIVAAGSSTMTLRFAPPTGTVGYRYAYLSIASNNPGAKNPYTLTLQGTAIAAPTATTTSPATAIAAGSATLNGSFKANHDTAVAYFQYKLNSSSTWLNSATSSISGFGATAVSKTLSGLTPGQVYNFRAAIYNSVNTSAAPVLGATVNFTAA